MRVRLAPRPNDTIIERVYHIVPSMQPEVIAVGEK